MINKAKLMKKWDDLKPETKAQILELAGKEIKDYFVPKEGEAYFLCLEHKHTMPTVIERVYSCSTFDKENVATGNCFRTKEEAIFAGNCEYYTKRFETYVNRYSEKIDWEQGNDYKYSVCYDTNEKFIYYKECMIERQQGTVYASSEQILKDAINEFDEENFLKYVLKVENEGEQV